MEGPQTQVQQTRMAVSETAKVAAEGLTEKKKMQHSQQQSPATESEKMQRTPAVNITFDKVTYRATTWRRMRPEKKEILHGVSGEFKSGEVSVIMGPSGAGKSTLLNILAGFVVRGSGGAVLVNGEQRGVGRGLEEFKKISCYIQQMDVVRPRLRVREAMSLAILLKLGCSLSSRSRQDKIRQLLEMLGLDRTEETYCGQLSGGQKKRLAIAFELVTNPPVLFLDEPTTGLDSCSTSSTVALLRRLAELQGRTVVCTLHQPSASQFSQFSQLYCVAEGRSIYQGPPGQLVTFLSRFGLLCPPYHNPADFMIEVASGDYPRDLVLLAKEAENFRTKYSSSTTKKLNVDEHGTRMYSLKNKKQKSSSSDSNIGSKSCLPKPASFWLQLLHLYSRNLIVLKRDYSMVICRLLSHLIIGLIFGYIYRDVGNNAQTLLANFIFVYGSNLFIHYTGQMTVLLSFPLEYEVLTREHFNRWYSLTPYCVSLLLVEIPFQIVCALVYLCPGYYLTGQPLETDRFVMFFLFNLAIAMTAQATGFLAGALLPITIAVFLAPVISVFFSVFGFTSRYLDISPPLRPFYNISYFRSAFQGAFTSLYGNNRSDLPCYEFYCHYKRPSKFLEEMDFSGFRTYPELAYILSVGALAYVATIFTVWYKLTHR